MFPLKLLFKLFLFSPHPRTFISLLSERERERNINWLPPTHDPTRDQTCSLLAHGTTLQLTEPHWPWLKMFYSSQESWSQYFEIMLQILFVFVTIEDIKDNAIFSCFLVSHVMIMTFKKENNHKSTIRNRHVK